MKSQILCTWCEMEYDREDMTTEDGDKVCIYCQSAYEAQMHRDAIAV
ncbi:MAG: hypothetical protein KAR06_04310 [Deltaproteobacteria bacterium]|nr:hypothetical protein [Deltaproteobacteria bacterium]